MSFTCDSLSGNFVRKSAQFSRVMFLLLGGVTFLFRQGFLRV